MYKIESEILLELTAGKDNDEAYFLIEENIIEQGRWYTLYEYVFKDKKENKFYRTYIRKGSTEYQEDEIDEFLECEEVFPQEVTITKYYPKISTLILNDDD